MTIVTESKESKKELQNILYSSVDAVTIVHEAKESLTITFVQQNNDPIFHDKLITGKILPLIMLEKQKEKTLIPYTMYHSITVPLSVKEQLIKYRKISQVNEEYVALITQIDISSEELFDKKHLGVLARLTTEINYLVNTSFSYIELLYIYTSTGTIDINHVEFLKTTNLNQRYNQIKESLAKLLIIKHKQHVEEIVSKAHESTTEVSEIPKGHIRQDIAMTGELTLKGRVLAIGGLKEKLSAAVRENITTVIIPEGNKRDLAKIPHEIKGILAIKTISHASELLDIVFVNKK